MSNSTVCCCSILCSLFMAENHADYWCANAVNCVSSPDVRAFLQMDNPKHQSDPSEDEDERSSRKVIKQK